MIKNVTAYVRTVIDMDKFKQDTRNNYLYVSSRPYNGKQDDKGNFVLQKGAVVTLQVLEDHSEPVIDQRTGLVRENNYLETFDVTVVGAPYPLPYNKGDHVSLGAFLPESSYYIDHNLILRFAEIMPHSKKDGGRHDDDKA